MTAKYLARYASGEAAVAEVGLRALLRPGPEVVWRDVCVVPVFDEEPGFLAGLVPAMSRDSLLIVVVNASEVAGAAALARNAAVITALREQSGSVHTVASEPPMWLCRDVAVNIAGNGAAVLAAVLVIDRSSPGWRLAADQGVGTARRIGCDIALSLWAGRMLGSPWIHTTDADVILPERYFAAAAEAHADAVALTYAFAHHAGPDLAESRHEQTALDLYDLSLRYYVRGLSWAGSPYAFHTVGSTLAVRAPAYAAVRGVPHRRAAEDFYLLNKLAKLGRIHVPTAAGEPPVITVLGRPSGRVPFGTGPAIRKIAGELGSSGMFSMYSPRVFAALRHFLEALDRFVKSPGQGALLPSTSAGSGENGRDVLTPAELAALAEAAASMGAPEAVADACSRVSAASARSVLVRRKRVHDWFDGFRTLKLIHALRDAGVASLANQPWRQAVAAAPFMAGIDPHAPPAAAARAALLADLTR